MKWVCFHIKHVQPFFILLGLGVHEGLLDYTLQITAQREAVFFSYLQNVTQAIPSHRNTKHAHLLLYCGLNTTN